MNKNKKLRFLVVPALALVLGLAVTGCGNDPVDTANNPPAGPSATIKLPVAGSTFNLPMGVKIDAEATLSRVTAEDEADLTFLWAWTGTTTPDSTVATLTGEATKKVSITNAHTGADNAENVVGTLTFTGVKDKGGADEVEVVKASVTINFLRTKQSVKWLVGADKTETANSSADMYSLANATKIRLEVKMPPEHIGSFTASDVTIKQSAGWESDKAGDDVTVSKLDTETDWGFAVEVENNITGTAENVSISVTLEGPCFAGGEQAFIFYIAAAGDE